MKVDPGFRIEGSEAEQNTARTIAWEPPALPSMGQIDIGRWHGAPTWTPPGTRALVRHVAEDGTRLVSAERASPRGYSIEFDLGLVHVHGQPGTQRVISGPDGFFCTAVEGATAPEYRALGHVEQFALPMLQALEVRRVHATGQETLVSSTADPLYFASDHVATLGFLDGYPVQPREVKDQRVLRYTTGLWRGRADDGFHVYSIATDPAGDVDSLGGVWKKTGPGFIPLVVGADGIVSSPLLTPAPRDRSLKVGVRWAAAPLGWAHGRLPEPWGVRASMRRLADLPGHVVRRGAAAASGPATLGHVRREPHPQWSALYSATHAVTGDQYLTRSRIEASDMGYRIDGILGYVTNHAHAPDRTGVHREIMWASRFGQRRRYHEHPAD